MEEHKEVIFFVMIIAVIAGAIALAVIVATKRVKFEEDCYSRHRSKIEKCIENHGDDCFKNVLRYCTEFE